MAKPGSGLPKSDVIWWNGKQVPWDQAQVHVLSHVLHYGSSVFEGLRAYETKDGPAVVGLKAHMDRLRYSAKTIRMEIPFTTQQLCDAVLETIDRNGHRSCYIRPLAFRGYHSLGVYPRNCPVETIIATWQWGAYLGEEAQTLGVDVGVSSWRRTAPGAGLPMAKVGGQYVNSQMVVMEARDRGFVEGIVLDVHGYVSEGSGENLFLVKDGVLMTPPLASSILAGITRAYAMQIAKDHHFEVREMVLNREMLYAADEAFFTGTAVEITPIRSVDGLPVGDGRPGPITQAIQSDYFAIVRGEKPDRHGWLTPVVKSAR